MERIDWNLGKCTNVHEYDFIPQKWPKFDKNKLHFSHHLSILVIQKKRQKNRGAGILQGRQLTNQNNPFLIQEFQTKNLIKGFNLLVIKLKAIYHPKNLFYIINKFYKNALTIFKICDLFMIFVCHFVSCAA